jgi:hypothetical protein
MGDQDLDRGSAPYALIKGKGSLILPAIGHDEDPKGTLRRNLLRGGWKHPPVGGGEKEHNPMRLELDATEQAILIVSLARRIKTLSDLKKESTIAAEKDWLGEEIHRSRTLEAKILEMSR